VDSSPVAKPDRMVVAGPVNDDSAISWTGLRRVDVKCSVRIWITLARSSPMTTATKGRRVSMYSHERRNTPTAEAKAETKNPRLMAFIPCSVSLRGETARIPMIDVITPIALTKSGNMTPTIAPLGESAKAAAPRMIDATRVTS
jgi:hypothetical protein